MPAVGLLGRQPNFAALITNCATANQASVRL
jgi:hypothetical protein